MKISLNWLKKFVNIPETLDPKELGNLITLHTAEVESVENQAEKFAHMVVGKILSIRPHPNADKLRITETEIGKETKTIVCGATNIREGMKVVVALAGAKVKWHGESDPVEIKNCEIRGEKSEGMICAAEEIGVEEIFKPIDHGIIDLGDNFAKVGTPLADVIGSDIIFEVDNKSLTHRPDLWGHYGFAREIAAILKTPLKKLNEELKHGPEEKVAILKIIIKDREICPRFSGCLVSGIKIAPSPKWLKEKLAVAGLNSINNIVDITNYVMLEIGEPMHAYDRNLVGGDELIIREAQKGEKLTLLDESEYELHKGDPIVCNGKNEALGLAGIKGGLKSGIRNETTEIILEAASWNPILIRKTSQKHGLRTDASQRFEKSPDPKLTETAIKRALNLIKKCSPDSRIMGKITTVGSWRETPITIAISCKKICEKIGTKIKREEIVAILQRLEFKIKEEKDLLNVTIPTFRATKDVNIEDDLVEEVARMHGYDNIPAILPILNVKLPRENLKRRRTHHARTILALGLGFDEIYTYSYLGQRDIENTLLKIENHIELENFLSEDQSHLRSTLVPNILKKAEENTRNFDGFRIFDIGLTFIPSERELPLQEKYLVAACILSKKSKDEAFYEAKGATEEFMKEFTTQKIRYLKTDQVPVYAHPKKCLAIVRGRDTVGHIFTLHPVVADNWHLENDCALLELNLSAIISETEKVRVYKPIPKFPGANFDISVVVDEKVETAEIEATIMGLNKKLVQKVELFDIYRHNERLGQGKKALAFNIALQAEDRTLSEQETDAFIKNTINALKKLGEVRGG